MRRAVRADALAVCGIQAASYPVAFQESTATVSAILSEGLSWVFVDDDDRVVGYALVHETSDLRTPPHLNEIAPFFAHGSGHMFLRDVCVAPSHRSLGIGKALVRSVLADARVARASLSLVSMEDRVWFWVQFGMMPSKDCAWDYRAEYGPGAMLMVACG